MRLATSFPGWVSIDPMTGKGPPNWKTGLLVILGLFPIVMLEMRFLSPILAALGLHASLATFVCNSVSVLGTTFVTMPLFIRWFGWWLFPEKTCRAGSRRSASDFWQPSLRWRSARSGLYCLGEKQGSEVSSSSATIPVFLGLRK
jgi:hypothetical protein